MATLCCGCCSEHLYLIEGFSEISQVPWLVGSRGVAPGPGLMVLATPTPLVI